ncbi:hypothetical protein AMTR_s00016p00190000 [Amborella trichopoda]|uniref:Uncharacterized protein n=2 Tax=Amborella trichopoda TaxID=13333 RepID=W1PE61_AMBTC|nr:hypothetical protein AMTR_s00016p00190000 [Amborella trichopoda]
MKSSLKKLRGFTIHKSDARKEDYRPLSQLDELEQASKDMEEMRSCYDSFLIAAAATANSAFEFSESLKEMGACLLEKTALIDDEDSGRVLIMLGKAQYELQKLVDNYRSHIIQTITNPSESLLNELQTVEEMKSQCDEKREVYEFMKAARRDKSKSRNTKGESYSSQLQTAQEEYNEQATLFVFRLKSLKQGQSRSLLTQATRHHAAQLSFFRKGLKSLEGIEAHVKQVTEQQHIDYQFSELEEDDADYGDEDEGYDAFDDGELSFDNEQNDDEMELDQINHASVSPVKTISSQVNIDRPQRHYHAVVSKPRLGSQSAPISAATTEKPRSLPSTTTRKFHTYVLPIPLDAKNSPTTQDHGTRPMSTRGPAHSLYHSSPLEQNKHCGESRPKQSSERIRFSVLKENNFNRPTIQSKGSLPKFNSRIPSDTKRIKRHAFSGPLPGNSLSRKPIISHSGFGDSTENPLLGYGILTRVPVSHSPRLSPSASPPLTSPKISELHELPRPPSSSAKSPRPSNSITYSAPLAPKRNQEPLTVNRVTFLTPTAASPLPTPPGTVLYSFSIPSSRQKAGALQSTKSSEASPGKETIEEVFSPPLTPIAFSNIKRASSASALEGHAKKNQW